MIGRCLATTSSRQQQARGRRTKLRKGGELVAGTLSLCLGNQAASGGELWWSNLTRQDGRDKTTDESACPG
jgi:hypothetical protein